MSRFILGPTNRRLVLGLLANLDSSKAWEIVCKQLPLRSVEQNRKLWACLTDISGQVEWYGQHYSKEDWKDILTAGLKKQRLAPGIDGGLVVLGSRTSHMSVTEMVELIEFIQWFGVEKGVRWSEREAA